MKAARDWRTRPPHAPMLERERGGEWEMNVGRVCGEGEEGGKWLEVGLGFPPTSQKTKQNKKNWWYWKRQILRKPRKTQRGQFEEEEKTNANVNTEKKNKKRYAHIVIREQLRSLLVFPK